MSYYPEFADSIENRLAKEDRPSKWLADRLGVNASTVTRWLNDGTRPGNPDVVIKIAEILRIEKNILLIAAGYGYQDAPNVKAQAAEEPQSKKSTDNTTQNKSGGGIHFYAPPEIHGDVIEGGTVNKTVYYNADGAVTLKSDQDIIHDENDTGSSE